MDFPVVDPKHRRLKTWLLPMLGALSILMVCGLLGLALTNLVAGRMLNREAQVEQEFLNSIVIAEASAAKLFDKPAPSTALLSFSNHVRSIPGLLRANVYSPDRYIRFSTEANLIGIRFIENPELDEGFEGNLSAELFHPGQDTKAEHLAIIPPDGGKVIEAYLPVMDSAGRTVAVVELYKSPLSASLAIGETARVIWLAILAAALALLVLLLAFVKAAGPPRRP